MDLSQLSAPEHEGEELSLARKKEVVDQLRALVKSPGWQYLCKVIAQQRLTVLSGLTEAGSMDALLQINSELREIRTYEYLVGLPELIMLEFDQETSHET